MPRLLSDRDNFVRKIERRRDTVRFVSHAKHRFGLAPRPSRAEVYDATFRSDEEAVSYFYALRNDHLPDFANPTWINEKVRWQFLHHANPLMSLAADKIAMRDYLRFKGSVFAPPEIVAMGSTPEELLAADLPRRYVLKAAAGSGQNHFEDGTRATPRAELLAKLDYWDRHDYWRHAGEMHYRAIEKRWLVEELVTPSDRIIEYKFYCIHGEPIFVLVISDRVGTRYKCALFDLDWKPAGFHWRDFPATAASTERPAALATLIDEARRLSEDFLHVRVDFMQCGDRVLFSELTFSGGAARNPFVPLVKNVEFGRMVDLARAPEYLARGQQIAAGLGWPGALQKQQRSAPAVRWQPAPVFGYPAQEV